MFYKCITSPFVVVVFAVCLRLHALVGYQQSAAFCVWDTLTQQSPWNNSDRGAHHRQFVLHFAAVACSEGRPALPSREPAPLGSLASLVNLSGSKVWIYTVLLFSTCTAFACKFDCFYMSNFCAAIYKLGSWLRGHFQTIFKENVIMTLGGGVRAMTLILARTSNHTF